jgi:outer membrane protein TolC
MRFGMSETLVRHLWTRRLPRVRPVLAGMALGLLASCSTIDVSSMEDFIGSSSGEAAPRSRARRETERTAGPVAPGPASRPAPGTAPAAPVAGPPAAGAPASAPEPGTYTITVQDALLVALENNRSLAVERLSPQIRRTVEQQALAEFDPVVTAGVSYKRNRITRPPTTQVAEGGGAEVGVREFLPTGTTLQLDGTTDMVQGDFREDDAWVSRVALTATQALLQGGGIAVNLVTVRQARIDVLTSQYELRGFAQDLVAQVEETYWDCALAGRQIEIVQNALSVAEQQYAETRERIRLGKLAEVELAAAEAEVALRREELINARSALETTRLRLWRLLSPTRVTADDASIGLTSLPATPPSEPDDVAAHIALAMRMRPDLNQARLLIQRNELELVRTRNGLLPRLDLFATLGATGYASSFGSSLHNVGNKNYDVLVGLSGEFPPINREARARNTRALLDRDQARLALENLAQLAEVDVRGAFIELQRAEEQVRATAVTRRLQEEKLRAETEKFSVGKSTSLLVAAAQRDLLSGQIAEVRAVVTHLKALIELRRLEGSLLEYRGITCPGGEPVSLGG